MLHGHTKTIRRVPGLDRRPVSAVAVREAVDVYQENQKNPPSRIECRYQLI
jgi:hypothetical protein